MLLADQVRQATTALQNGDADTAATLLADIVEHSDLIAATDMIDIRARLHCLYGQALLALERLPEARTQTDIAFALACELNDDKGKQAVAGLQHQITSAALAGFQQKMNERELRNISNADLPQLEAQATTQVDFADLIIKKAHIEATSGQESHAIQLAEQALQLAIQHQATKEGVLSRILLAHLCPTRATRLLTDAWSDAEANSNFALVTAISRAAQQMNVELPSLHGPAM